MREVADREQDHEATAQPAPAAQFASSTTSFISQTVIGGVRLIYLPLVIWQQSLVVYNWPLAAVASLSLVVSVLTVIAALSYLGRRSSRHLYG